MKTFHCFGNTNINKCLTFQMIFHIFQSEEATNKREKCSKRKVIQFSQLKFIRRFRIKKRIEI